MFHIIMYISIRINYYFPCLFKKNVINVYYTKNDKNNYFIDLFDDFPINWRHIDTIELKNSNYNNYNKCDSFFGPVNEQGYMLNYLENYYSALSKKGLISTNYKIIDETCILEKNHGLLQQSMEER